MGGGLCLRKAQGNFSMGVGVRSQFQTTADVQLEFSRHGQRRRRCSKLGRIAKFGIGILAQEETYCLEGAGGGWRGGMERAGE